MVYNLLYVAKICGAEVSNYCCWSGAGCSCGINKLKLVASREGSEDIYEEATREASDNYATAAVVIPVINSINGNK